MLFSLPLLALAAALHQPAPSVPTRLHGHLDHAPAGDTVRLEYAGHYGHRQAAKTVLGPTGDFALTLPDVARPVTAQFSYAGQRTNLYLRPGDDLGLTLDFSRFDETLRYDGRAAAANNYLAQSLYKFEFGPAGALPRPFTTATTTPAQIRQVADAFRQQRRAFLETYAKANPLPDEFRRDAALDIDLAWATVLLEYPADFRRLARHEPELPANYFDFLRQVPFKEVEAAQKVDRGLQGNTAVLRLLNGYGNFLVPGGVLSTDPAEAGRLFARATADFGPTTARDLAMYMLYLWKVDANLAGVQAAFPTFRAQSRDTVLTRDLRGAIARQQVIQSNVMAPAFALLDNTGKKVSLADLRGKIVYLDFWGTWCAPCMQEMPASIELKKKFAGRDVAFVFISVGDKEEKWQRVLAAAHLTSPNSVHLRSPEQDDPNGVASRYDIHSYPAYWLIGRDGRIISRAAPRPSSGAEAVAAIEQALAK